MAAVTQATVGGIAYREARPDTGGDSAPAALLLHGYPESSYIWRHVLPAIADAGHRALAPDLPGFGDSPADLPGTWERQIDNVERFRTELGLERLALVVHDWGGLIGLRWACDHPETVTALVISDTGFFPDGKWHGLAELLRTEGQGEEFMANVTRELFGAALRQASSNIADDVLDEFWKAYGDEQRRQNQLDLYRSGDFAKLEPYEGRLAELEVPALVLWGGKDEFAPVAGAHRFVKELADARLVVIEEAGHFLQEDAPEEVAGEIGTFFRSLS